ncbi:MAG: hypothetical protein Fur0010_13570 [Bdellovibrio sp.]
MSLNIELLRQSFEKVVPISEQVADQFYTFLWGDYPAAKALFKGVDMKTQKKALIKSLVYIVDHLDNPEKLSEYLRQMGKRHVDYGTKEEHYELVGNTLIKTFAHFFGNDWTEELNDEWIKAYGAITTWMLEGAAWREPDADVIRKRAQHIANNLMLEMLEQEMDEDFKERVRNKVRSVIFEVMEEESHKLYKHKKAA